MKRHFFSEKQLLISLAASLCTTVLIFIGFVGTNASAQEYGLAIGIHQTTATVDNAGLTLVGNTSGKLNFDAGLAVAFELVPNLRFRTGAMYDQRQFDYKVTSPPLVAGTYSYKFAYIDVPINVQYNFTPMIGIYGGLTVGILANNSVTTPSAVTNFTVNNAKSLYPLLNLGVSLTFDDQIGFDLYYENGLGDFADHYSNFSSFGMHFIYWL